MLGGNEMINKLVRVFGLGLMIATFAFAGFAQTQEEKTAVYDKYMKNYQSDKVEELQIALDAAKEYNTKFTKEEDKAQNDYFKDAIPTLEKAILDKKGGAACKAESDAWYAQLKKVVDTNNAANTSKNWTETYAQGKTAIDKQFQCLDKPSGLKGDTVKGQKLDISIALGTIGFDRAVEKNDTYNNDALNYLKSSIQQLESGQTGATTFGKTLGYNLESKDNAIGLLNYYVGYILYYRQNKKDEALGYFYKATQGNSTAKNFAAIYENIGAKYYDKIAEMDPQRIEAIKANDGVETEATKAMLAEERGNAERGIEAYSKALKAAQADAKSSQKYKDSLRATLEQLYKFRFDEKAEGLDAYINTSAAKPLTNPTEPVKPIVVEAPATTTPASTTTTTPGAKPATTTTTKPAATTTPASTTTTKPAATTTTTKPAVTSTSTKTSTTTKTTTPKKPRKR